jgi:predicted dehydrogenase
MYEVPPNGPTRSRVTTRYGVIGTGYFGAPLARALAMLPDADVVALHDPANAEPLAAELGSRVEPSAETVATATDVDVVVVASPNHVHAGQAIAAARSGHHVFCEKPITLDRAAGAAMVAAARDAGVLFMAGHVMHFMNGVRLVKQRVQEGALGQVVHARAVRTGWQVPRPGTSWKQTRALSGGHLYHHIHELDLVQALMGPAVRAHMAGGSVVHRASGPDAEDDLLVATLEMGDGRTASLTYGSAFRWPEHHVLVQGTLGAALIDLQTSTVEVRTPGGVERVGLHRTPEEDEDRRATYSATAAGGGVTHGSPGRDLPPWLQGIVEAEMAYLHTVVRGAPVQEEYQSLTDGTAAAASIATADALRLSLAEGRVVDIAEVDAPVAVAGAESREEATSWR